MDPVLMKQTAGRLIAIRTELLEQYPFFGRLLMHLPFGFAECETAYTDMRRIVFDPAFAARLTDEELRFVMLHELMHCVLKHCTRARGKIPLLYNIACDIVVNSVLLEAMNEQEFFIDGCKLMHRAPDRKEGRCYSAEEIYTMLCEKTTEQIKKLLAEGAVLDNHGSWNSIRSGSYLDDLWNGNITRAAKCAGSGSGIPGQIKRLISKTENTPRISWRQVLQDFIRFDRSDYDFHPPDRRFQDEFLLPSFLDNRYGAKVEHIWFVIDSSGSVSNEDLSEAMGELRNAIDQIDHVEGLISFFDTQVSEPIPFETVDQLNQIEPVGGGGTDFNAIFHALSEHFTENDLPCAIVIITDGYASFPEEEAARDIPVIWIITEHNIEAPWGECIHIDPET